VDEVTDLFLRDGKVEAVGRDIGRPDDALVVDASTKIVAPGLIDLHVHLREPGQEDVETVATGAMAAAAGGFSAVCAMPNTDPVTDNQAAVGFIVSQAQRAGKARVYPIGAVSLGQKGQQLAEFGELVGAGAVAVSDDGKPVASSHLMRTALEYARTFGIPVADHCEDPTLAAGGAMHEGLVSTRLGLKGVPAAAEEIMVARDILLAELTGGHVHLCHMSTRGSVGLLRRAKEQGLRVTAEACPHHFTLTHEACEGYNTNAKMNPPLREAEDREAIRQALKDGTIDVICTDHAPHHYDAKEREFDDAPNGIIGLETALGLAITELVEGKLIDLATLVRRMSEMPARIFGLPGGTLAPGSPGDVVVFDPGARWTVNPNEFFSKSRNTPFAGRTLRGRADLTIVRGQVVFQRAERREKSEGGTGPA
jgi:dihydroorotase